MKYTREIIFKARSVVVILAGLIFFLSYDAQKAFAAACISNGGTCWAVEDCSAYTSKGKDLIAVPAGDTACANVYESPVKCCKIGSASSSKPGASSKGADSTSATPGGNNTSCNPNDKTQFCNPLRFNSVEEFLAGFLTALQRIIAVVALIMIVIGALQYITSMGGKQTETAKKTITAALVGLAIAIAAPSFLKEISILLGWAPDNAAVAGAKTLTEIALSVLNFLLAILGIIALVMMVVGGTYYATAAGDSKRAEEGKNIAKYAIIGVIVAMASMVMLQQVARFFAN